VALTDGAEALQERRAAALPGFTVVLDILHVLEYLWAAAQVAHGGWPSPACHTYLHQQLEALLPGQTQAVIDDLMAKLDGLADYRRRAVQEAIRCFTNHAAFLRYDQYLARGWPIASGVIEGACKHVVRDRMERSGMRWTHPGAQAMLQMRCVRLNDDWDDYQLGFRAISTTTCPSGVCCALTTTCCGAGRSAQTAGPQRQVRCSFRGDADRGLLEDRVQNGTRCTTASGNPRNPRSEGLPDHDQPGRAGRLG
jgi:hypothetical protein